MNRSPGMNKIKTDPQGITGLCHLIIRTEEKTKMEKRLDGKDIGLDCDGRVYTLPGEEVFHKIGGHNQVFHRKKQFLKGFYKKTGAAIHEWICGRSKDCLGGACQL